MLDLPDHLVKAYTDGEPLPPIAEALGISVPKLYQVMRKAGWFRIGPHDLQTRRRIPRPLSDKDQGWLDDLRGARKSGMTYREIAEELDVTRQAVYQRLYNLETKERNWFDAKRRLNSLDANP